MGRGISCVAFAILELPVPQAGLRLRDLAASASQVMGSKACTPPPSRATPQPFLWHDPHSHTFRLQPSTSQGSCVCLPGTSEPAHMLSGPPAYLTWITDCFPLPHTHTQIHTAACLTLMSLSEASWGLVQAIKEAWPSENTEMSQPAPQTSSGLDT